MSPAVAELRWDVPSAERLDALVTARLPLGLRGRPAPRTFHRDLYFDTPDRDLERRGVSCRLRFDVEDRRSLALDLGAGGGRFESPVAELEPR